MKWPKLLPEPVGAEATLRRKLDLHLVPYLSFLYFLSYLDRSNIANVHDPITESLDLSERQYSMAVGVFYIGYISCEVPANLILKKANPAYWIGSLVVAWGICSVAMAFVTDFQSLMLVRTFLGIAESGFFPGVVYYLSRWYKPEEQSFRLAMFYCSSAMAGTIGGLLASGLLKIEVALGLEGWQWLFIIEGAPSILLGVITWYVLPSSPLKASWLTPEDRELSQSRLYHISKTDDHKQVDFREVLKTLLNIKVWAFAFLFLSVGIPGNAKTFYAPAIISEMGYSTTESNLLSALLSFATFLYILFNGWHSDKVQEKPYHILVPMTLAIVGFAGLTVSTYFDIPELSYAFMFLGAMQGCCLPVMLSWLGLAINSSTEMATATAVFISVGNFGGIIGPNLYGFLYIEPVVEGEEGSYIYGHLSMVIILVLGVILGIVLKIFVPSTAGPKRDEVLHSVDSIDGDLNGDERRPLLKEVVH